jgi:hypothetical protein
VLQKSSTSSQRSPGGKPTHAPFMQRPDTDAQSKPIG